MSDELKALGASAHNKDLYQQAGINPGLLEYFTSPHTQPDALGNLWEKISSPEFTCLCPITGQPDFATIDVYYAPDERCVESKSYKLYLGSFRNVGTFHEATCARILLDLVRLLEPHWMLVVGRFTPRGGIPFQPRMYVGDVPREILYRE